MQIPLHIGPEALSQLRQDLEALSPTKVIVLFDENTAKHCARLLGPHLPAHRHIKMPAGEPNKNLETCSMVWSKLLAMDADRKSVLINLGGGVVGDLGGFTAGCFKRGIRFIQVPTSLLAMVDASIGNKTGVDFESGKNLVGLFNPPEGVYILPEFLNTLPERELRSGFAEVIKHWLIGDRKGWEKYTPTGTIPTDWTNIIPESVAVKRRIVAEDPLEQGIRKALNFGHTIGHAVESASLNGPEDQRLLHGEAVAAGLVCESWLSYQRGLLPEADLQAIRSYIEKIFPELRKKAQEWVPATWAEWLKMDKKNEGGRILCTFLEGIGEVRVNQEISVEEAEKSWEVYLNG